MNTHLNEGQFQRPALGIGQHNGGRLDDSGKATLHGGPMVYCAEWTDNDGRTSNLIVPASTAFAPVDKPQLFNSITTLTATVPAVRIDAATNSISTAHAHGLSGNSVA